MISFCYSLVGGWTQNSADPINRIPKAYIGTPRGEVYSKHKTLLNSEIRQTANFFPNL